MPFRQHWLTSEPSVSSNLCVPSTGFTEGDTRFGFLYGTQVLMLTHQILYQLNLPSLSPHRLLKPLLEQGIPPSVLLSLGPVPLCQFQGIQHEGREPGPTSQEVLTWTLELLDPASYWHFQISMQGMCVLSTWFLNTKLLCEERNANVLAICEMLLPVGHSTDPQVPFAP